MSIKFFRSWATEFGLIKYKPGPWSIERWDKAYSKGYLNYFADLSERPRYSVLLGYFAHISDIGENGLGNVLDVGCGNGLLYSRARHIPRNSWKGFDISRVAIDQATYLAKTYSDETAKFKCADILHSLTTLEEAFFQTIVINEVLNMCEDPGKLLEKCKNSLARDGVLVISAWRHRGDRQLWSIINKHFKIIDYVEVKSSSSRLAGRGWRLAYLQHFGISE